jgi:hypothetical protein
MPWCDTCNRYLSSPNLDADGSCPNCDSGVNLGDRTQPKIPWHFWLLVIAAGAYLGWRALQGLVWLVGQI